MQENILTQPSGGGEAQPDFTPQHPTDEGDTARMIKKKTTDREKSLYPGRRNIMLLSLVFTFGMLASFFFIHFDRVRCYIFRLATNTAKM